MSGAPTLFLSAGEVSGDMHGAWLARALRARAPGVRLVGVGGPQMAAAGVEILADVTGHSAVGLTENLPHVVPVAQAFGRAKAWIAHERPALVVLIDYQGANMALSKYARGLGLKTAYYILPQEWLWGFKGGLAKVAGCADRLIAVFEPEAEAYRQAGGNVSYVGHPLIDILAAAPEAGLALEGTGPVVALLPGSRRQEITRLLPVFLATANRVAARRPDARFVLPVASPALADAIEPMVKASGVPVQVVHGGSQALLRRADVALAASGTVTLEAAILGVPCVAAYRVSAVTAWLARRLLKVRHVTLPNIVAGAEVVPEYLQGRVEPAGLATALLSYLEDPAQVEATREAMRGVRERLGGPGAIARAAELILQDANWTAPSEGIAVPTR